MYLLKFYPAITHFCTHTTFAYMTNTVFTPRLRVLGVVGTDATKAPTTDVSVRRRIDVIGRLIVVAVAAIKYVSLAAGL